MASHLEEVKVGNHPLLLTKDIMSMRTGEATPWWVVFTGTVKWVSEPRLEAGAPGAVSSTALPPRPYLKQWAAVRIQRASKMPPPLMC